MLTLFTTAKPFQGHSAIIQRNALESRRPRLINYCNAFAALITAYRYSPLLEQWQLKLFQALGRKEAQMQRPE